MQDFLHRSIVYGLMIALLFLAFAMATRAQQPSQQRPSSQQTTVSDKELKAFVKAYVQYQKIRMEYEPSLREAQDPKEKERRQKEADSKVDTVLKKEGLTPESYNKIFTTVNSQEDLRKKVLKMIDEERKRMQS